MLLTVRIFAALQLFCYAAHCDPFHSPLKKYADQWNKKYFLSANTAANATFLNKEEKLAIDVLNLARLSTRLFAATVIEPFKGNGYTPECASLINTMSGISSLKIIYSLQEISRAAKQQTAYGLNNPQAELSLEALNGMLVSSSNNAPVQLIINLLVDATDNLKTARNFCLGNYNYPGILMQPPAGSYNSAIRFKIDIERKNAVVVNTSKKFTTQWKGEFNIAENDLTEGYTIIKARQELFKDNDSRTIEKLVIPWLLFYTNTYRKKNELDTLKYDACLIKAATYQTDYLFNESKKSHQLKLVHTQNPNSEWFKGESPSDRALAAGCKKYCGENALYTTLSSISPAEFKNRQNLNLKAQKIARNMVYDQWHNSKGHRENMLTASYTCMGVSVAIGKQSIDDANSNTSDEQSIPEDNNIRWIAFGVQVMAY